VLGTTPLHCAATRGRAAVAQRQRGRPFFGVAHAPHLAKLLRPGQIGTELGEHATASLHGCQLVGVADQHGLDPGGGGGDPQLAQLAGADHGGLIDDDEGVGMQPQPAFAAIFERLGDRHAGVAGAPANRSVDGLAGGGQHQHAAVVEVACGSAQGPH
jgi:hypothetical protein